MTPFLMACRDLHSSDLEIAGAFSTAAPGDATGFTQDLRSHPVLGQDR
jgi:hypothetical protein